MYCTHSAAKPLGCFPLQGTRQVTTTASSPAIWKFRLVCLFGPREGLGNSNTNVAVAFVAGVSSVSSRCCLDAQIKLHHCDKAAYCTKLNTGINTRRVLPVQERVALQQNSKGYRDQLCCTTAASPVPDALALAARLGRITNARRKG